MLNFDSNPITNCICGYRVLTNLSMQKNQNEIKRINLVLPISQKQYLRHPRDHVTYLQSINQYNQA